jgi:hypothetical protein
MSVTKVANGTAILAGVDGRTIYVATAGEASPDEIDLYARVAGNLRRLLEAVGLQRRARDVGPTLGDLLREDLQRQREAAARAQEQRLAEAGGAHG